MIGVTRTHRLGNDVICQYFHHYYHFFFFLFFGSSYFHNSFLQRPLLLFSVTTFSNRTAPWIKKLI